MNSDTVKPIPATALTPTMWLHARRREDGRVRAVTASQLNEATPTSLPMTSPTVTPSEHRGRIRERLGRQGNAGVGQREDRDDHVAGPGMKGVDEPIAGRHRAADQRRGGPYVVGVKFGAVLENIDDLVGLELGLHGPGRGEQTQDDTGDRGVNA